MARSKLQEEKEIWYKKLQEEGFNDIESGNTSELFVSSQIIRSNMIASERFRTRKNEKLIIKEMVNTISTFKREMDRVILLLRYEGKSTYQISDYLINNCKELNKNHRCNSGCLILPNRPCVKHTFKPLSQRAVLKRIKLLISDYQDAKK